jgi:hypothetical protein
MSTVKAEILYAAFRKRVIVSGVKVPPYWLELPEYERQAWEAAAEVALAPRPVRNSGGFCVSCGAHESEMHLERCPYAPRNTYPQHLQGEFSTVHICTCGGSSSTGHTKTCASRTPIHYENL